MRREDSDDSFLCNESGNQTDHVDEAEALEKTKQEMFGMTQKEEKVINSIRSLALSLLFTVTVSLALTTYIALRRTQRADFNKAFQNKAQKIISAFDEKASIRVQALTAFAETMVSFAKASNMTWPMVTIPDFEKRGRRVLEMTSLISLLYCPVVTEDERSAWETYTQNSQWWLRESLAEQERQKNAQWVPTDEWYESIGTLPSTIVDLQGNYFTGEGPYTPTWYANSRF